ncbi:glycogenin-1-like isoform X3 [Oscarella lobularis]|uniref:glycogenin-1-like isoform X3 n=1 Tax=Oscarella lobularis TaxID=121494 RepID=UPI0033140E44
MRGLLGRPCKRTTLRLAFYLVAVVLLTSIVTIIRRFNEITEASRHLASLIAHDSSRMRAADIVAARQHWRMIGLEERYMRSECANVTSRHTYAWITALGNEIVALPALVAGHTVRTFSCHRRMIALVAAETVSSATRRALVDAGYEVRVVDSLDCNWMDVRQGRRKRNVGFPGTYMRFYIWSYEWLRKVVYFDPDYMFMSQVDELFELEADFAASYGAPPGVIHMGFNAGLLVIKPNRTSYNDLMSLWYAKSTSGNCPNDQHLLWAYFKTRRRWTPLPFAYNVRTHLYFPMKAYHFAGTYFYGKPWDMCPRPSRETVRRFKGPIDEVKDMYMLWWKYAYEAIDKYRLRDWWEKHSQNTCHRTY